MGRNDRLIPLVWIAFVPLAVLTAIFGPLLVLFPGSTANFWAWEIKPAMSAVWVGAGYTFGALAITTMLVVGKWRGGVVAIIATWPFSIVMLVATLLHMDRFFLGTLNFYVWLAIYIGLPVLLPVIFWLNKGQDPGPQTGEALVPGRLSLGAGALGVVLILVSLLMVVSPASAASFWPWQLTPLMSRVVGGWVMFLGTGLSCLFLERRYVAYRYFLPSAGTWMAILFAASFFHLDNFNFNRAGSWLWFALVGAAAAGVFGLFVYLERQSHRPGDKTPAVAQGVAG